MPTPRSFLETLRLAALRPELPERLDQAQRRHFERLRGVVADPNTVGIGISEKMIEGVRTGTLALTFYVKVKRPRSDLDGAMIVPNIVASPRGRALFTDVFEIGDVVPQAQAAHTPIQSGFSASHHLSGPGTLGAIVQTATGPAALSNAHVLARSGQAPLGSAILYPSQADGGREPEDRIGSLSACAELLGGGGYRNRFDAALAAIAPERVAELVFDIPGATRPITSAAPRRDMRVRLSGRSSGVTHSVVRDEDATVKLPYAGVGLVGFYGQCRCDPYTAGGDSGAVVVDEDSGAVVGLHFAASTEGSYFSPIKPIMDALKFTF